ncbi:hypothetical protein RBU61_13995 [Tissierella sp. MB52-C2]|uniref:hypothetical protein n=1 Tax=Tissierella sp. MB52-C2 TaxID=3070999 RepID=UPI00280C2BB1|nr:hypothetical protein [Tissierella sp. MB52-C2]WMM24027.1 hypothetical protein RBU61_13995 [Tissierella sp. MB52-C2]
MIKIDDDFEDIIEDVNLSLELINFNDKYDNIGYEKEKSDVDYIIKGIIFFKYLESDDYCDKNHYFDSMLYNALMSLYSVYNHSAHIFYFFYRSYIENLIRVILELDNESEKGVMSLFKSFKNLHSTDDWNDLYNYLESEYGTASCYIHSNVKANIKISTYLREILENENMSVIDRASCINNLKNMINKSILIFIENDYLRVSRGFNRRQKRLKFLIGDENNKIYKDKVHLLS